MSVNTKIFDKFFVLVQFLQSFGIHARDVVGDGFITMLLITENADRHLWSWDMLEPVEVKELLILSSRVTTTFCSSQTDRVGQVMICSHKTEVKLSLPKIFE